MKFRFALLSAVYLASAAVAQAAPAAAPAIAAAPAAASANALTPDALINTVSSDVLAQIKNDKAIQAGDVGKIATLVDQKIMPYVDFQRMTASAVGRNWRSATPEQQAKIQAEFKTLLVRTYAGALSQVRNHTISVKPLRAAPSDTEVVVKSELKSGSQQPIALDYRLEKTAQGWRVYDMNVMGVWLIETYRADFGSVINAGGIDNLIAKLQERNKANAAKS
ncbi:MAG: phospholipid-binding protein MlaC [Brachymonas sp.]|jgi:phospholipid transport system substrate-binding protein